MTTVLDCSATLAWVFDDETNPAIDRIMADVTDSGAVAPGLWLAEVANGLQAAVRRKRIDASFRDRALLQLAMRRRLPVTTLDAALARACMAAGVVVRP